MKKKIIKNADSVRVVSERLKEWVVDKYGIANDRIFVIPIYTEYESGIKNHESGIKNQGLRNNLLAQAGEMKKLEIRNWKLEKNFTILTVGRLVKVKNIKLQIEAMADVIKIFPDVRLVIVGDGPEKEKLHRLANRLKLKDKVEFKGWQEKVKPYYENADLFLLTSNSEGWGLVVVEAMKFGLPVIMTDVGCAGEVIKNEKNGIVIPIKDKKALIAAISEMIANKEKREVFAEKGLETVNKLPDKEETLGLYRRMWE